MPITLHWYLPTHGDGRTLLQSRPSPLVRYNRQAEIGGHRRATTDYLAQVAQAAEQAGFDAALTPTGTDCDDAWITTAIVSQYVKHLRFLVAFRPGTISPTLAAQQASAYQRHTGGRLLLNIVTGGEELEQRRFGDPLDKDGRYARTDEFLTIFKGACSGEPFSFHGEHLWAENAIAYGLDAPPEIYFGGSSDAALRVAARHADVYLTWGEPPNQLGEHLDRVRDLAEGAGRRLRHGIRLHVVSRDSADEAWAAAEALIADADEATLQNAYEQTSGAAAVGQQRMAALHRGSRENLEIYPNLWAGVGLLRGGAGTAMVGSHEQVADLIEDYHRLGIDEFILSGYPHLEEALYFGEGVFPILARRGLLETSRPTTATVAA